MGTRHRLESANTLLRLDNCIGDECCPWDVPPNIIRPYGAGGAGQTLGPWDKHHSLQEASVGPDET
jgi:hypothetical protein